MPPDIAVEVVSLTPRDQRRDRIDKVIDYAAFGIKWYWIIDPEMRELEIYELGSDGRYIRALSGGEERIESVPGCHGLVLDLPALWAKVDRLGPPEETPTPPEGDDA